GGMKSGSLNGVTVGLGFASYSRGSPSGGQRNLNSVRLVSRAWPGFPVLAYGGLAGHPGCNDDSSLSAPTSQVGAAQTPPATATTLASAKKSPFFHRLRVIFLMMSRIPRPSARISAAGSPLAGSPRRHM